MSKKVYQVFAVDSADRWTLLVPAAGGAPEFKQIILSLINAPKPARRQGREGLIPDEPCGYEAMDFARAMVIGKEVAFEEDYVIEALQRVSGRVTLKDGTDVGAAIVKAGFATVNDRPHPKIEKSIHEKYSELMLQAKTNKLGVHHANAKNKVRNIKQFPPANPDELAKTLNGSEHKVRIDRVQSGSFLFVTVLSNWQQMQINLTGIQSPSATKGDTFGAEAKFFSERMLLNRHVTIRFEGQDNFGNFLGSVVSPKGTFQEQLLQKGFAKIMQATLINASDKDALRAAEAKGIEGKLNLFKDHVERGSVTVTGKDATEEKPVNNEYSGVKDFEATVIQIINGDTIVVRNINTNENVKISLCGLRGCKNIKKDQDAGKAHESRVSYEDYSWESKEFLRSKFLGVQVGVHVEYGRHFEDTGDVRAVASVVDDASGVNLAAALLAQGYGKFFLGKTDVCSCADDLQEAEASAKARGVGIHNSKDAPVTKIVELNRLGENKAKYYLSFLQRGMQGNRPPVWKGICDIALSGSSFRVYIPREHFQISLKLAGIISPSGGFNNEPADPFSQEAKDFAVNNVQQREVEIQVDTCDRAGNFIGNLSVKGKNFAVSAVEAGLATVANADRLTYHHQLDAAQKAAKDAKKYIWSGADLVPQKQVKREQELLKLRPDSFAKCNTAENQWSRVTIADVIDGNTVTIQEETTAAQQKRTAVQAAVQNAVQSAGGSAYTPKKNEAIVALFKEDKKWYRAKVHVIYADEQRAEVSFTDFGNRTEVKFKDIRAIPTGGEFAILKETPALAHQVKLSYLRNRTVEQEFCDEACDEIWAFVEDVPAPVARCDYVDGHGHKFFSVAESPTGATVTDRLLKEGLGIAAKPAIALDKDAKIRCDAMQNVARKAHSRLWRYGDVGDDDEEDY